MKTLEQILDEIESFGYYTKEEVLSSEAKYLAQDRDGGVFGFSGMPYKRALYAEWWVGDTKECERIIYCGELPKPENWKECIWELPKSGEMQLS